MNPSFPKWINANNRAVILKKDNEYAFTNYKFGIPPFHELLHSILMVDLAQKMGIDNPILRNSHILICLI